MRNGESRHKKERMWIKYNCIDGEYRFVGSINGDPVFFGCTGLREYEKAFTFAEFLAEQKGCSLDRFYRVETNGFQ